jgi:hypothetical protein
MAEFEPVLNIKFDVIAYDEGGYGDNRSRDFTDGNAAVEYAKSLDARFHPHVYKRITMNPMSICIWPPKE